MNAKALFSSVIVIGLMATTPAMADCVNLPNLIKCKDAQGNSTDVTHAGNYVGGGMTQTTSVDAQGNKASDNTTVVGGQSGTAVYGNGYDYGNGAGPVGTSGLYTGAAQAIPTVTGVTAAGGSVVPGSAVVPPGNTARPVGNAVGSTVPVNTVGASTAIDTTSDGAAVNSGGSTSLVKSTSCGPAGCTSP